MSVLDATTPFRRAAGGVGAWLFDCALAAAPAMMAALRRVWPIAGRGKFWLVTRYDDVLEVFASNTSFGVAYRTNLDIITNTQPFILGMDDTPAYRAQLGAWRALIKPADMPALGDAAEARAAAILASSGGEVEVVDFVRRVAFDVYSDYFGIPDPSPGRLAIWGSRLFEFQFTGTPDDTSWVAEVETLGTAMRNHVDATIAARRTSASGPDDVLGRALAGQAAGTPGYDDVAIRTVLMCMLVGGPPQPPMLVSQGIEQLLRRPEWLAAAGAAAAANDDVRLRQLLNEAMRFDPLAPGLKRTVLAPYVLARGTSRATTIMPGATVVAAFASAMMDPRRVPDPQRFDPDRLPRDYVHFGHGLHECFGREFNAATLHRMIKPLLARRGLRRAAGAPGRLRKNGIFADRLVVTFE